MGSTIGFSKIVTFASTNNLTPAIPAVYRMVMPSFHKLEMRRRKENEANLLVCHIFGLGPFVWIEDLYMPMFWANGEGTIQSSEVLTYSWLLIGLMFPKLPRKAWILGQCIWYVYLLCGRWNIAIFHLFCPKVKEFFILSSIIVANSPSIHWQHDAPLIISDEERGEIKRLSLYAFYQVICSKASNRVFSENFSLKINFS